MISVLPVSPAAGASRARDLGIPFDGSPGKWNAITDVPGVEVGYATVVAGNGAHAARTGVTVVFPRGKRNFDPVFAAWAPINDVGEMTGTGFIQEEGLLEGPVSTTNSLSVGAVRDAISKWMVRTWNWTSICCLPVVAETWDGYLNDIDGFHVTERDVFRAIEDASSGPVREGNIGGGTGMMLFGFKGGMGTSSRIVTGSWGQYTVGVLVQANFGIPSELRIGGVEVGREMQSQDARRAATEKESPREHGSIIIIIGTDAPLLPHQLRRLAQRAANGLALTGSINGDLSGDIAVAFSTANHGLVGVSTATESTLADAPVVRVDMLPSSHIDQFFAAVIQATEEAVINALMVAETMTGKDGHRVEAIDQAQVLEILDRHRMLVRGASH